MWVRVGNVYNLISSTRSKAIEKVFKKSTKYQQEPEERDLDADITAVASYEINFATGWTSTYTYDPQSTSSSMLLSPIGTVVSKIATSSKNYEGRDIWNDTYKSQNGTSVWAGVPRRILPEVGNLNIHSEYFKGWRDAVKNTILKANDKDDYLISFPYAENISSILLINKVEYLLPEERYEINGQVYTVKDYTNYFSAPFMLSSAFRKGIDRPHVVVTLDVGLPSQREAYGNVNSIREGNKLYVWDPYKESWLDVLLDQHPYRYTEPEVMYYQETLSGYFFNGNDTDEPKGYMISSWFGNYIYKIRIDELIPEADFAEALMYGVNHPINVGTDLLTKRTTAKQTLESHFGVKGGAFMFDVLERIKDDMSVNENGDTKLEVLGKLMKDIQGLPAYLKIYDPKTTMLWVEKYEIVNNGTGKRILFKERFPVPFLVPLKNRKKAIWDWDIDTIHDMESLLRSVCYVPYD